MMKSTTDLRREGEGVSSILSETDAAPNHSTKLSKYELAGTILSEAARSSAESSMALSAAA